MADARPQLRALAHRLGVEDGYHSALDQRWVETNDDTREALVRAMGFAAESESAAEASLARLGEVGAGPAASAPSSRVASDDGGRCFGIVANLYSIRSPHDLGFGNFRDLQALVEFAARERAAFVGLNPLHATVHRRGVFSPYQPVSRCFRDPLYLDPERVPEFMDCPEARRLLASDGLRARVATLGAARSLDVAASEALLFEVLRPLHARFRTGSGAAAETRRRDFDAYRTSQGDALRDYATFEALADAFEAESGGRDACRWPEAYRRPDTAAVRRFRDRHRDGVEWHAWLQFELERQLAAIADAARAAGLSIGLYTDLALGSRAGGSDVWSSPESFVRDVSVGAPPDAFAPEGQDWSFPPLDPHALRRDGFAFWRRLLDANLRHAGALRIDHALGLRRQFWIPKGATAREGAYVRYPEAELIAVALEAARSRRALLIAEDLGTVPEGFSEELRAHGMLSSCVLPFERDADGLRPPADYPRQCLATANTHDLPPLAALDGDADLLLRRRVGQIPDDDALAQRRSERERERRELVDCLLRAGVLARSPEPCVDSDQLASAVTAFLCATPARLVGLALDDLAGEAEPINLPGVGPDRHPSWTRKLRSTLEDVFESARARRMLAAVSPDRHCRVPEDASRA